MLALAAALLLAFCTYAVFGLHWWVIEGHSAPLWIGCAIVFVLALLQFRSPSRRASRVLAAFDLVYLALIVVGSLVLTHYPSDRPTGPALGATFPRVELADASSARVVTLGAPSAGKRAQFVVLFRGFW